MARVCWDCGLRSTTDDLEDGERDEPTCPNCGGVVEADA